MMWEPRQVEPDFEAEPPYRPSLPAPPSAPEREAWPRPRRWRWPRILREVIETALLALLIFLAVRSAVQNFKVEGDSMVPSLDDGQYIIVNKLAYAQFDLGIFDFLPFFDAGEDSTIHLLGSPGRGDVIVFKSPNDPNRDFIKRVIGVGGDKVEIRDGVVYVNGEALEEPYITGRNTCPCQTWEVPEGRYFVMGDHRNNSSDSRSFGFVPEKNIIGKAWFSYWPLEDVGLAPNHSITFASDQATESR